VKLPAGWQFKRRALGWDLDRLGPGQFAGRLCDLRHRDLPRLRDSRVTRVGAHWTHLEPEPLVGACVAADWAGPGAAAATSAHRPRHQLQSACDCGWSGAQKALPHVSKTHTKASCPTGITAALLLQAMHLGTLCHSVAVVALRRVGDCALLARRASQAEVSKVTRPSSTLAAQPQLSHVAVQFPLG
jgi:hypothetical protein